LNRIAIIMTLILILSACNLNHTPPTSNASSIDSTSILDPLLSSTPELTSTQFSTPAIISIQSMPTFNPAAIATRTPQAPAQCPVEDASLVPQIANIIREEFDYNSSDYVLEYLNSGGTYERLAEPVTLIPKWYDEEVTERLDVAQVDLTGDSVPEIILRDPLSFNIFSCKQGKYDTVMQAYGDQIPRFIDSQDLNLDGIPDVVLVEDCCSNFIMRVYLIFTWNGSSFISVLKSPGYHSYYGNIRTDEYEYGYIDAFNEEETYGWIWVDGVADEIPGIDLPAFRDIDGNGTKEIIISGGIPASGYALQNGGPWRVETVTFAWNGSTFIPVDWEVNTPTYRFQAVQDGDAYTLLGKYDQALTSYQMAIFNDMDYWSAARLQHQIDTYYSSGDPSIPIPTQPGPDPAEYPNLAAYARIKIMLLHVAQGHLPEARTVYETLLSKFPAGKEGSIYADLARLFWEEYQVSQDLDAACALVTQQVASQPETYLEYLGNREGRADMPFGWWSLSYKPEDLCPFRTPNP
jgi:tetratricopeptide (TPR) repeat protein